MKSMKRLFGVVAVLALLCSGGVVQAATWDLFYDAVPSNTGPTGNTVLRLSSPDYGYLRYKPDTPFALNDLIMLSTDFNMVQGPFVNGAPRFDIGLDFNNDGIWNDRLIWTYWGNQPWGGGTPPIDWTNTGNFMGTALWPNITFFDGNTQYTAAGLKSAFGTLNVMRAYVSLDGGSVGSPQILDIDNFMINNDVYSAAPVATPEPATMLLFGLGLLGLAGVRRKLKK